MKRLAIGVYALFFVLAYVYLTTDDSSGVAIGPAPAASSSVVAKASAPVASSGIVRPPPPAAGSSVAATAPAPVAGPVAARGPAAGGSFVPLFSPATKLEPATIIDTPTALITRVADRGRDRHAREWMFHVYEHYLPDYWIDRTSSLEIVDTVAKGGKTITFNMVTLAPSDLKDLRAFYEGKFSIAQYSSNEQAKETSPLHFTATVSMNTKERRPLKIGDRMEIEWSVFLRTANPPGSRTNYYGTAFLYVVGQGGMQPWEWHDTIEDAHNWKRKGNEDANTPVVIAPLDSFPLPEMARSGGMTTRHQSYSNEPLSQFEQMATNTAPIDGQPFMLGRRLAHTDFATGAHSEPDNPVFTEMAGKLGSRYAAGTCVDCKGPVPPDIGKPLIKYLVKVGSDAKGTTPHPMLGFVLQPLAAKGATPEGSVSISGWTTIPGTFADGTPYTLRKPVYKFTGPTPEFYSIRLAPAKPMGQGLFEAVDENFVASIAATNGGRMNLVTDPQTGQVRMGRYGAKAGIATLKQLVSKRLNDAMSITTTIYPKSDRGSAQTDLDSPSHKLADADVENIFRYYALRAVPPRRDFNDPQVKKGEALFHMARCDNCHVPTLKTSPYHPMAELRNQTIHPLTDMLLHDMGPGLADNMGDGSATGSEWRTRPLWSCGLVPPMLGTEAWLHDGRARSLSEAILWHGGQANGQKEAFRNMAAEDRASLIKFLQSL